MDDAQQRHFRRFQWHAGMLHFAQPLEQQLPQAMDHSVPQLARPIGIGFPFLGRLGRIDRAAHFGAGDAMNAFQQPAQDR